MSVDGARSRHSTKRGGRSDALTRTRYRTKAAIGFYIGKQGLESTYGAAASIVVVLIWVYYTSQIILMGAEITHSYAEHNSSLGRSS